MLAFIMIAVFTILQPAVFTFAAEDIEDGHEYIELLSVTIPLSLDFVIDPFEIANRGMIYSNDFIIENHGTNDVILYISDITVIYNDSEIIPLARPFSGGFSDTSKSIYLSLDFNRPDATQPVVATTYNNNVIEIPLYTPNGDENDSLSRATLNLSGNVNPHPDKEWVSGDVKINVSYLLEEIITHDNNTHDNSGGTNDPEQSAKPEDPTEPNIPEDPEEPDQSDNTGDLNEEND